VIFRDVQEVSQTSNEGNLLGMQGMHTIQEVGCSNSLTRPGLVAAPGKCENRVPSKITSFPGGITMYTTFSGTSVLWYIHDIYIPP
jgi:hypothetical protein